MATARFICIFLAWITCAHAELPDSVKLELERERIPLDSVSVYAKVLATPRNSSAPAIFRQAEQPMNPASTMKLLTTYAGLELLGPAYRWHTDILHDGVLKNGT